MRTDLQLWMRNTSDILRGKPWALKFTKTLQAVVEFVQDNQWQGACHAVSSVFYVLLAEQGISSVLCIGEVQIGVRAFNHSWIEIDGEVCDAAIISTLNERFHFLPTINGLNVETKKPTDLKYGVVTSLADDPPTRHIKTASFTSFMDEFPYHRDGLWSVVLAIGKKIGVNSDVATLRTGYSSTKWNVKN